MFKSHCLCTIISIIVGNIKPSQYLPLDSWDHFFLNTLDRFQDPPLHPHLILSFHGILNMRYSGTEFNEFELGRLTTFRRFKSRITDSKLWMHEGKQAGVGRFYFWEYIFYPMASAPIYPWNHLVPKAPPCICLWKSTI